MKIRDHLDVLIAIKNLRQKDTKKDISLMLTYWVNLDFLDDSEFITVFETIYEVCKCRKPRAMIRAYLLII